MKRAYALAVTVVITAIFSSPVYAALLINCQFASQAGPDGGPGNNGISTTA